MSDSQNPENSRANSNFASILSITLLSWFVLLPIVNSIELPFTENDTGVIATVAIEEFSPYTDYLKFIILLFVPAAIAFILFRLKAKFRSQLLKLMLAVIENKTIVSIFTLGLIFIWSVDRLFLDVGIPLTDAFHEGEYLGYLPNFLQLDRPFLKSIFIHGFGLDVIPSLLAHWWVGDGDNGIAMTRFFYFCTSVLATFSYFWVLGEITGLFNFHYRRYIFSFLVIFCCLFEKFFFLVDGGRSLFFMIQLALTLRFFSLIDSKKLNRQQFSSIAFCLGLLIPLSFLHTYDRAMYFILVYILVCALSLSLDKKNYLTWLISSIFGIILSGFLMILTLGWVQVLEILSQVSYWSKYSRDMFSLAMPDLKINLVGQLYLLPMLVQSLTFVYLVGDFFNTHKIKFFIQKHFYLLVLLLVGLLYMRIGLDRSGFYMAAQGGFPTFLLVIYLGLRFYQKYLKARSELFFTSPTHKILLATIALAVVCAEPGFSLSNLSGRFDNLTKSNTEILQPAHLEVLETFKADIERQSCFYTANTEGIWYYLFDKPSCSKFGNIYYALPTVAQQVVIRELEATQPERILLTDGLILTGRTLADSTPLILQYILDRYRPDRLVTERWLWRRNETPLQVTRNVAPSGTLDRWCIVEGERECKAMPAPGERQKLRRGKRIYTLEGSAVLPEPNQPADAVYLSYGSSDRLVATARVNPDATWSLAIPSMVLPLGKEMVRMWAYDASSDRLQPIGYDIEIKIVR